MKILNMSLALAMCIVLCASCSKDAEEIKSDVKVEKTFGISNTISVTRAAMTNFPNNIEGTQPGFKWVDGDQITVFAQGHETGDPFTFQNFIGQIIHQGKFSGKTYEADNYVILYPAQSTARLTEGNKVTFNIPTSQRAINNTFDPEACIQIGKGSKNANLISLKNVCAFFYVTLGPGCHYLSVTAENSDWHLAGTCTAKVNSAGDAIESFGDGSSSQIELTNIPQEGGTFFIAFIPSTSAGTDIKVTYRFDAGNIEQHLGANNNFVAGHLYNLGNIQN